MEHFFGRGSLGLLVVVAVAGPVIIGLGRRKAPLSRLLLVIGTAVFGVVGALQIQNAAARPLLFIGTSLSYPLQVNAEGRQSIIVAPLAGPFMESVSLSLTHKDGYPEDQPGFSSKSLWPADFRVAGVSPSWMHPHVSVEGIKLDLADLELTEPVEVTYTVSKELRPLLESSVIRVGLNKYGITQLGHLRFSEWTTGLLSLLWTILGLGLQASILIRKDSHESANRL
jgi:hypothetical protein